MRRTLPILALPSLRLGLLAAAVLLASCARVPITGRRQLNMLPESEMMSMSLTEYNQFLQQNDPMPATDQRVVMVRRIGDRLSKAATKYLNEHKAGDRVAGFNWEFNLVQSDQVNAWCMPGGKVVVYTGILPVTQDEANLAIVMGHEISHAIARHGNERMSQSMLAQYAGVGIDVLAAYKPGAASDIFKQSFGIGSQLGLLAYSRQHESEADKLGLVFMAMAGYDPRVAPAFWQRMSQQGGAKPPEWMSTHPSDETRIKDIQTFLPEAMKYYVPQ